MSDSDWNPDRLDDNPPAPDPPPFPWQGPQATALIPRSTAAALDALATGDGGETQRALDAALASYNAAAGLDDAVAVRLLYVATDDVAEFVNELCTGLTAHPIQVAGWLMTLGAALMQEDAP